MFVSRRQGHMCRGIRPQWFHEVQDRLRICNEVFKTFRPCEARPRAFAGQASHVGVGRGCPLRHPLQGGLWLSPEKGPHCRLLPAIGSRSCRSSALA